MTDGVAPTRQVRKPAVVVLGLVLALLGGFVLATSAVAGGEVPRGTSVLGVDVSGRSRADAEATLARALGPRADDPIRVRVEGEEHSITPSRAGLSFDAAATADAVASRGSGVLQSVRRLIGGGPVEPAVRVDEPALARAVTRLAERVDVPLSERTIRFSGTEPVLVEPAAGRRLDRDRAQVLLRDAYLRVDSGSEPVELPIRRMEPAVSEQEARRALEQIARPAVAAPVTLRGNGRTIQASPQLIASALRFEPVEGQLVPRVDGAALATALTEEFDAVETRAIDARITIKDDRPLIVPSRDGQAVNKSALGEAVLRVLERRMDRVAEIPFIPTTQPALTTTEAQALGIKEKLSSYTQRFPSEPYRVRNITTAARYLDGTVLQPGEVFSMNKTVKERNAENGYVVGQIIRDGRLRRDYGGAVSTITTAVWDAAFHAGLGRVEQRGHSYWIP
ncbi:MAG: VanW family protein, partial [Actinomycetota bacterium]|nr:VanW family protein [Actinomycetota bacterium]